MQVNIGKNSNLTRTLITLPKQKEINPATIFDRQRSRWNLEVLLKATKIKTELREVKCKYTIKQTNVGQRCWPFTTNEGGRER